MSGQENYRQLRPEERIALAGMKLQGQSIRAMARRLDRAPSTVSRELARNGQDNGRYDAQAAQVRHTRRRRAARPAPKLQITGLVWATVVALLEWKWSPQQIAATLKRVYPNELHWHMSHETIYTAIYALPGASCAAT